MSDKSQKIGLLDLSLVWDCLFLRFEKILVSYYVKYRWVLPYSWLSNKYHESIDHDFHKLYRTYFLSIQLLDLVYFFDLLHQLGHLNIVIVKSDESVDKTHRKVVGGFLLLN